MKLVTEKKKKNEYSSGRIEVERLSRERDIKCSIRPNELLVGAVLLHPSGLIQILLNNHKFLKCETSAQNVSFLSQNHFCIFSRSQKDTSY